jgi:hypothetical protein
VGVLPLTGVGALLAVRRTRNAVGWLFLISGLAWSLGNVAQLYAATTLHWDSLPGGVWGAWLLEWLWLPGVLPPLVLIPLLFPNGQPPSPRWRPLLWGAVALVVLAALHAALTPIQLDAYLYLPETDNPAASAALEPMFDGTRLVELALYPIAILGSFAALGWRLWRARGVERQQVKWFVFVATLIVASFAVATVVESQRTSGIAGALTGILWGAILLLVTVGLPVAIGMAILRYRLYDIDHIINRTLVYTLLTAALLGLYLALVLGLGNLVSERTGESSQLVVAASTLIVAALFRPLRRAIQAAVDQRFNRSRYDAARTLDAFSQRLRDQTDLSELSGALQAAVADAIQPAHLSLWLRSPATGLDRHSRAIG